MLIPKWTLLHGTIYAPQEDTGINTILCSVYLSIDSDNVSTHRFRVSKAPQRREFVQVVQELLSAGYICRQDVSKQLYPSPTATSIAAEKRNHTTYPRAYVKHTSAVDTLAAENECLRKRLADTERLIQLTNQLKSITNGYNAVNDEIRIMNSLAGRLNLDIVWISPVTSKIKSLACNIQNMEEIESLLQSDTAWRRFIRSHVPANIQHRVTARRSDQANQEYELDLITHVEAPLDVVRSSIQGDSAHAEHVAGKIVVFYDSEQDRETHYSIMKEQGLTPRMQTSTRYTHVYHASFDIMEYYRQAVAFPVSLETSRSGRKSAARTLRRQSHSAETGTIPLVLEVWVDAWRGLTTAVKIRFLDDSHKVFPSGATPPFRILEYNGPESLITEHFAFIEQSIESTHREVLEVRNTGLLCRVTRVFIIADHPAMSKVCGALIGGNYPSPFSSVHSKNKGWSPFGRTPRCTLADILLAKHKSQFDTVMDREAKWGSFYNHQKKCIAPTLFETSTASLPRDCVFLFPPIMHVSHDFVSLIHAMCRMFKPEPIDPDSDPRQIKEVKARNAMLANLASFEPPSRTTGCNEQVKGRKMIASIGLKLHRAFPPPVQSLFILAAYLQEHYYSHEDVTENMVVWHRLTALLVHLFSVTMCLSTSNTVAPDIPIRQPSATPDTAPCVDTLHGLARIAALPEIQAKTRASFGRVIEECFERDFIGNQESRVRLRQNQTVLESTILKEQVELLFRCLRGVISYGRRETDVPPQSPLKLMRIHKCCKDANWWLRIRSVHSKTLTATECQKAAHGVYEGSQRPMAHCLVESRL
ncbi:hypothetical protein J8273_8438 [Carpediemonas membranifera]|uniref:Uncharacterized protein n=1 Tax=Carpediemonas membranifera TaxID=201153 RepID=A0A8J6AXL4_9EUKA|nr:hypothetical protein J8273_8438 [Carpediemonas membranifera]|eukprot:KAG9389764.1 hypothetical protein J8273_8438 [Carpediemonas membranifera]